MFQVKTKIKKTPQNRKGEKETLWSLEAKLPGTYRATAKEPPDVISTQAGLFGLSITCTATILCSRRNT